MNKIFKYIKIKENDKFLHLYKTHSDKINKLSSEIKINTVIMVKNQENLIIDSINSANQFSDLIYIMDTGSTDSTKEKILNANFKNVILFEKDWVENYSEMRNDSIKNIKNGEWIFVLDSDEILKEEIDIRKLKQELAFIQYFYNKQDVVLTIKQESVQNNVISQPQRIFLKSPSIKFYGFVHEELRSKKIFEFNTNIFISNQGTSIEEINKFDKYQRYNALLLKNLELEPNYIKWVALIDLEYGKTHIKDYLNLLKKFHDNIISNGIQKSSDLFEMRIFMSKIENDIKENNLLDATLSNNFALKYFNENSIFIYFKNIIELFTINRQYTKLLLQVKGDIDKLKFKAKLNTTDNNISIDTKLFEELVIKLLFKIENFQLANLLMSERNIQEESLLFYENQFINSISKEQKT